MKMIPGMEVGDDVIDDVTGSNPRHVYKVTKLLPYTHSCVLVGSSGKPFEYDVLRLKWSDDLKMWVSK